MSSQNKRHAHRFSDTYSQNFITSLHLQNPLYDPDNTHNTPNANHYPRSRSVSHNTTNSFRNGFYFSPNKSILPELNENFYEEPESEIASNFPVVGPTFILNSNLEFYKPANPVYVPDSTVFESKTVGTALKSDERELEFYKKPEIGPDELEIEVLREQYLYDIGKEDKVESHPAQVAEVDKSVHTLEIQRDKRSEEYEEILNNLQIIADKLPDDSADTAAICTLGCIIVDLQARISPITTLSELQNSNQLNFTHSLLQPLRALSTLQHLSFKNFDQIEKDNLLEVINHTINYLQFRNAGDKASRRETILYNQNSLQRRKKHDDAATVFNLNSVWRSDVSEDEHNIWKSSSTLSLDRSKSKRQERKGFAILTELRDAILRDDKVNVDKLAEVLTTSQRGHGIWGIDQVVTVLEAALDKAILHELTVISDCVDSFQPQSRRASMQFTSTLERRKSHIMSLTKSPPQTIQNSSLQAPTNNTISSENSVLFDFSDSESHHFSQQTQSSAHYHHDTERSSSPNQVSELHWLKVKSGAEIPAEADPAGYDFDGNPLYIARVLLNGVMHVGKSGPHLASIAITEDGIEKILPMGIEFEVLVDLEGLEWIDVNDVDRDIPSDITVQGGWDEDGRIVFVSRGKITVEVRSGVLDLINWTANGLTGGWSGLSSFGVGELAIKAALIPGKAIPEVGNFAIVGCSGREQRILPFEVLIMDDRLYLLMPKLPTEIVLRILILSANLYSPAHYLSLCLVHPTYYEELKSKTVLGKFGKFSHRLDLLFYDPKYKSWIEEKVAAAESVILRLLTCAQSYWKQKFAEEIDPGLKAPRTPVENVMEIPENISKEGFEYWKTSKGCAHRALNLSVRAGMESAVRFMINDLGASSSQKHLWYSGKDLGQNSVVFHAFHAPGGVKLSMLRMLVKECHVSTYCYNGFYTLLEEYIDLEDPDNEVDEEVLLLMMEGGANLEEALSYMDYPSTPGTSLSLSYARQMNFSKVEAYLLNLERSGREPIAGVDFLDEIMNE
ncbi:hypothetical protein HK098_002292 [Nowakowskiella sp. JEL0407]|nr:hypothetical protein HK098_002292 [Nowakowskiella sp. JEL0407]